MTQLIVMSPDDLKTLVHGAVLEAIGATKKPEVWLTVQEVAKRLGKTDKTIRRWISESILTRVSAGDGSPYRISSLEVAELSRSANSCGDVS
ncbi:helix-turn-helix domain-containing protein [uncultured Algimonas sp.]|uniref:helix-turn-helix domain-containing protein n=1 Tax=uncultured Algimonas sp. TaxID=1547920 RepID=UPI002623271A|nr:helix-turn-helix domain-containing protein [uncultured Algimonas sp.]